jgi:hypothetical protein
MYIKRLKKFRENCSQGMLVLGEESSVFQFVIQKYEDIKNYNFACCFVWVYNLVSHIEGGT